MTILDLKKEILKAKKYDIETSKGYGAVLVQVERQTIGKVGVLKSEKELILDGAKKELKEQKQSMDAGAPYSEETIKVCESLISALDEVKMSEDELEAVIKEIAKEKSAGLIFKKLKSEYGNKVDMAKAQKIIAQYLK